MLTRRQNRIQRTYTTVVVVVTTAAGAYAINQRAAGDRADARRAEALRVEADAHRISQHAAETNARFAELRLQYSDVVQKAARTERSMLRDLAAARRAAKRSGHQPAPVTYSTTVGTTFAAAAPVSSAAAAAPTSGTS